MRAMLVVVALVVFISSGAAVAADPIEVQATLETEPFFDADGADADDPAIWVHPSNGAKSIVVGTLKNGGLAVFDLQGRTIQRIDYADEDARQNNVDLLYALRSAAPDETSPLSPTGASITCACSPSTRQARLRHPL
jgi:3-phytase